MYPGIRRIGGDEFPDQRGLAGTGFGRNGDDSPLRLCGKCEYMSQAVQLFVAL
jgi:hypothetical protein